MTIKQQTLVFINTLLLSITMVSAAQIHHGAFSMGASNTARHQTAMGQPIVSSHTEKDSSLQDGLWDIRFMEAEFTLSDNWGYLDLEVNLNNISSAYRTSIDSCFWDFGDGFYSNDVSPVHTFQDHDVYSVSLIISDNYGQDSDPHIEMINLLIGDINLDLSVNVVDVIVLVDLIINTPDTYNIDADLNQDGLLSILDIIALINIILA